MRGRSGFTLIELLIVILVIGVLMGLVVTVLNPGYLNRRGKDGRRQADLVSVKGALELYYLDNSRLYPNTNYSGLQGLLAPYLDQFPQDPQSGQSYSYTQNNRQCYRLRAINETEGGWIVVCGGPKSCQLGWWGCP